MKDLFIDCPTGISSDMLLAALLDLGVPKDFVESSIKSLPLVHIFDEMRNILLNNTVDFYEITKSISISLVYFVLAIIIFYISYAGARKSGTLINMGE